VLPRKIFFNPRHLGFTLSVSFYQCPIILVIYKLVLAEGQKNESWEHSKENAVSEIWQKNGYKFGV
jgi:hypothetical protein